jgi:hypothetical protein
MLDAGKVIKSNVIEGDTGRREYSFLFLVDLIILFDD